MATNQNQNSSTITGDVKSRIEALEAQFAAKQKEFKEKYL